MTFHSYIFSSNEDIWHFTVRLVIFAALILGLHVILSSWFESSFRELSALDRELASRVEVIYFGDSVLHYYARDDRTHLGIPEFLQQFLPDYSVGRSASKSVSSL